VKIQWPKEEIKNPIVKKKKDKVMWQDREMRKEKRKK